MIINVLDENKKEKICKEILKSLPDWFGIPESIAEYAHDSRKLPLWIDIEKEQVRGFIVLKETSQYTVEIYVIGVKQEFHRLGIGRALFYTFYQYAKEKGYEFIQVKTVQEGHYDAYDKTNAFYKSVGFRELECFPTYWCESNPCQIYVMNVR